ncbi:TetR/AcrR family transcriptional regulator [Streptomyces sp. DSM 44917]|uniref:TetR/AcrR family transcriptional regulator n=1 Tax=Streptomyces boetiae TaxID=3075541 RepID=A0ABU2LBA9_9ACTN|nr:TetR/AcrR family transcriptional regulator [Streptomyces sp. DSM 44917]MDT0308871.1 TetR/AcrR family transcriptional regulator [Streptomyces sp. DSM 44917]
MPPPTRKLLITAATDLLDAGGRESVTLREVGRRAGVSHNAPYKHFANKEALLAGVAAEELTKLSESLAALREGSRPEGEVLRAALGEYISWALAYPARYRLVFGVWSAPFEDLAVAAGSSYRTLMAIVEAAQRAEQLPPGDTQRMTALLQALIHGAIDLTMIGHLAIGGKGNADADGLVDDLLHHLRVSAAAVPAV